MLPSQELFNETSNVFFLWFLLVLSEIFYIAISYNILTGYTETAVLVNTESSSIVIQKQQSTQVYERPILYNEYVFYIISF